MWSVDGNDRAEGPGFDFICERAEQGDSNRAHVQHRGEPPQPLGPGSKEKRSAFETLGRAVGLDLEGVAGKVECGRRIAAVVKVPWDVSCYSAGDTVTLIGLNHLVDGAVDWLVTQGRVVEGDFVRALMSVQPVSHGNKNFEKGLFVDSLPGDLEHDIAEQIAELSALGVAPRGVAFVGAELDAAEVTFVDGAWRDHLAGVQGWLKFDEDLSDESAESFDASLVELLGLQRHAVDDETVAARLLERLEKAADLRTKFNEMLEAESEEAATLGSATQAWADAWEDLEEEEESEGSGPIKAAADTWPIAEFVQLAKDDDLELSPSYQRADVWPTADSQQLIESVLRGIPLPSVILLKEATSEATKYEVVDGKQRLTSILRFTGNHPVALEVVRRKAVEWSEPQLDQIFRDDYPKFRKLWKQHEPDSLTAQVERMNYFPFALRKGDVKPLSGDLEQLRGKYYSEIRGTSITVVGEKKRVASVFEQQSQYKVPVIVYESVTPGQVHEVFSLYNKQGKHLNAEEIRNALYHHLPLMRGLLVTAGDSENITDVAPFLVDDWEDLSSTSEVLDGYGFGKAGYKRTKLLSWVLAGLTLEEESAEITRSTAAHISAMLKKASEDRRSTFRSESVVLDAMLLLDHAVDAHAVIPDEAWAPAFKQQSKWQELQLVGTLIALAAARAVYEERLHSIVSERLDAISALSYSDGWRRPSKTQSKEQWMHTGRVVTTFLDTLDIPVPEAAEVVRQRFGSAGLERLAHMATLPY